MANLTVLVCDTPAQAAQAKQFLTRDGFSNITQEPAAVFSYDAQTYDGGSSEVLANKIIVIGRK
jgi:hypothetical protein